MKKLFAVLAFAILIVIAIPMVALAAEALPIAQEENDLSMWSFIVGFALPPIVAVVQQPGWSDRARALVTGVICVVVAAITTQVEHGLHIDQHLTSSILQVLVAAIATYHGFWKPTRIAPVIEHATAPGH